MSEILCNKYRENIKNIRLLACYKIGKLVMYYLFLILIIIIGLATTTITLISNNIILVTAKDYKEYSKMYETKIEYCEQIQYVGYISKDINCSNLILLGAPTDRLQMDKLIAEWIVMVEPVNERIKILKDLELPLP